MMVLMNCEETDLINRSKCHFQGRKGHFHIFMYINQCY